MQLLKYIFFILWAQSSGEIESRFDLDTITFTEITSHILKNIKFLMSFFFFYWQKPKMMHLSINICKNAQKTFNYNMAWRKLMRLLVVCVTNKKTMEDSGLFLQALMNHENDRKLIFLKEQQL